MGDTHRRGWGSTIAIFVVLVACGDDDVTPRDAGGDTSTPIDLGAPPDARVPEDADDRDLGDDRDARVPDDDAGARVDTTIGAAGGELRSSDGRATLTIPAGALSTDRMLSIERVELDDADVAGAAYDIEPSGVTFARPAALRIDVSLEELGDVAPEIVALSTSTDTGWEMIDPQARSEREDGGVTVVGLLAHLSRYVASFTHHFPRGACAECETEEWASCCLAGRCTTDSPAGLLGLVQGECRMNVTAEPLVENLFPTIEGFQVCYGLDRGNPIGPCSQCMVECALGPTRIAGAPTTVLGWRPTSVGSWSTAELCTAMTFLGSTSPMTHDATSITNCFRDCDEAGEGNRTCGPPPDPDAGPPPDRDAGPPPDRDAGPPDPPDAGPPDMGAPDAGPPDTGPPVCACDVDPICESTCLCDPDCTCTATSCGAASYCDPDRGCVACTGPPCTTPGSSCAIDLPCGVPIGTGVCVALGPECTRCMCPP